MKLGTKLLDHTESTNSNILYALSCKPVLVNICFPVLLVFVPLVPVDRFQPQISSVYVQFGGLDYVNYSVHNLKMVLTPSHLTEFSF